MLGVKGNNLKIVVRNCIVTLFITLVLAGINCNNKSVFLFFWMRSWLVASLISNAFSFIIFSDAIRNLKVTYKKNST